MDSSNYDAVIIGGGFSGLSCAQILAKKGLHTLVLEKKPWPGTKTHTTGIVVRELAESWNIPARLSKKIENVRLYSPNMDYLDLFSPEYYFLATDTSSLIRWHAEQAIQSGASIRYNTIYRQSEKTGTGHSLNCGDLNCRYLIGCDGALSRIANSFSLGRNRHFLFGIEADFGPVAELSQSHLHVFLDNDVAKGYIAWIVPGVHVTQIGMATRAPAVPSLDRFLAKLSRFWKINKADRLAARSGFIPCGGIVNPFYAKDVLLLGDAAGMVSPLTAGGIQPAVNIGKVAGELVADHLLYKGENPGRALRHELPQYFFKSKLRYLYDHLPITNRMYDSLISTPLFRLMAQTIFFHNRGFFSAAAWRDIVRLSLEF